MVDDEDASVSVELPEVLIGVGAKLAVTPEGKPDAASATLPVNPFSAPTVAVNAMDFPAVTVCDAGDAARLKSGVIVVDFTVTLTLAV